MCTYWFTGCSLELVSFRLLVKESDRELSNTWRNQLLDSLTRYAFIILLAILAKPNKKQHLPQLVKKQLNHTDQFMGDQPLLFLLWYYLMREKSNLHIIKEGKKYCRDILLLGWRIRHHSFKLIMAGNKLQYIYVSVCGLGL